MSDLPAVLIYTDGACDPNPGPGGWAAVLRGEDVNGELYVIDLGGAVYQLVAK